MQFFEAIRLALNTIRVQKLKSAFTLLGVCIGVMFLISVVSIVEGMGRYMEEDLIGKLIGINTFELRSRPNINIGDMDEATWAEYQRRPRLELLDVAPVTSALPADANVAQRYAVAWRIRPEGRTGDDRRHARHRRGGPEDL